MCTFVRVCQYVYFCTSGVSRGTFVLGVPHTFHHCALILVAVVVLIDTLAHWLEELQKPLPISVTHFLTLRRRWRILGPHTLVA